MQSEIYPVNPRIFWLTGVIAVHIQYIIYGRKTWNFGVYAA